jgi:AraC-like DNA-binding protein
MQYRYHKVNTQLVEYIRTVLEFDSGTDCEDCDLPLFTNGMSVLLCKADNCITLFGQPVPVEQWNETRIAFFFKPFALGTIFKLSAPDLKVKPIELNLWNAQKAMALKIQLHHSGSFQEKIEILSHFIFSQIEANKRDCEMIRYITDAILQNSNADILSKLLRELNLTERTFQRIFKKYVGVTASEYRRICQHYFAFSQLKGGHFGKLADIAYTNGYFDQSHYIRSFKEFTNTTPNEYLQSGLGKEQDKGE